MSDADSGQEIDNASEETSTDENMSIDEALSKALEGDRSDDLDQGGEVETEDDATEEVDDNGEPGGSDETEEPAENAAEAEPDEQETEEAAEPVLAPDHWPADRRDAFSKLDRDAQDLVLAQTKDVEAGFTRKSQELSEASKFAEVVRQEFEPFRDELALQGMDEVGGLRYLLAAHKAISSNPVQAITQLMTNSGLTVEDFMQPEGSQEMDPNVAALQNQVGQLTNHIQQTEAQQVAARNQDLNAQITAFKEETDDAGKLIHPHFEALRPLMSALLKDEQAEGLQDAYEKAIWASPDFRQSLIDEQTRASDEKKEADRKAAVDKAKKAGKRPPGGTPTKSKKEINSLDDAVGAAMEAHWN